MNHSYFVLISLRLDYPIFVGIPGFMSINQFLDHEVIWNVIRHVTSISFSDFSVEPCSSETFHKGLVKIDFISLLSVIIS